mgnify:CR=1 FL=1
MSMRRSTVGFSMLRKSLVAVSLTPTPVGKVASTGLLTSSISDTSFFYSILFCFAEQFDAENLVRIRAIEAGCVGVKPWIHDVRSVL